MPHRHKPRSVAPPVNPAMARARARLEKQVHKLWLLGRNIVLCWYRHGTQLHLGFVRNADLSRIAAEGREVLFSRVRGTDAHGFAALVERFSLETAAIELPPILASNESRDAIERIVALHSVAYEANGPVALVDIVGFSLLDPVEQLVQLNSLAYSLTMAERRCRQLGLELDIGQSTTGDGFYFWNRSRGPDGDARLFVALIMALSDNVIAAANGRENAAPRLRSAFATGGYFRFLQAEGAGPTTREYITGETTITLARLIDGALPGQILLSQPTRPDIGSDGTVLDFVERVRRAVESLRGVPLGGVRLSGFSIYATGRPDGSGGFAVDRYSVRDKHGLVHNAHNIKANLYQKAATPLFLGVMHREIAAHAATHSPLAGVPLP